MTELTKITTPFGLLDAETQEALRAHGGPWEIFTTVGWRDWQDFQINGVEMAFPPSSAVRVKPQPPKPRECVIGFHKNGGQVFLQSVEYAEEYGWTLGKDAFLFREVLE